MTDHQHYAGDIQGVAHEGHSHTPREIGAAEDHDLEMLRRELQAAQSDIRQLLARVNGLEKENARLEESFSVLAATVAGLGETVQKLAVATRTIGEETAAGFLAIAQKEMRGH